jgi:Tfp pilus assembly protein PilF
MAYWFDCQWDSAQSEFLTAIHREPHNVEARVQYGRFLNTRGLPLEALKQSRLAQSDDQGSAVVLAVMSWSYFLNHQIDSAVAVTGRALQNDPLNFPALGLGARVRLSNNQPNEARAYVDRAPGFPSSIYVIAKAGDTATARQRLRALDAMTPQPADAETKRAYAYLGLGDATRALDALERATDRKEIWHAASGIPDPAFDTIRDSSRFKVLVRRVGLTP